MTTKVSIFGLIYVFFIASIINDFSVRTAIQRILTDINLHVVLLACNKGCAKGDIGFTAMNLCAGTCISDGTFNL